MDFDLRRRLEELGDVSAFLLPTVCYREASSSCVGNTTKTAGFIFLNYVGMEHIFETLFTWMKCSPVNPVPRALISISSSTPVVFLWVACSRLLVLTKGVGLSGPPALQLGKVLVTNPKNSNLREKKKGNKVVRQ